MAGIAPTREIVDLDAVAVVKGTFWHLATDDCQRGRRRCHSDSEIIDAGVTNWDWEEQVSESSDAEVDSTSASVANCFSDGTDDRTTCGETRWSDSGQDDEASSPVSSNAEQCSFPDGCFWVHVPLLQTAGEGFAAHLPAVPSESSRNRRGRHRRARHLGLSSVESDVQELTTVMLKNIPNNLSRTALLELFDAAGFQGFYDFVYLPIDQDSDVNVGYAFVNLTDADAGQEFWKVFNGFCEWGWDRASTKVCYLEWSQMQGLDAHVQRYRNSPLLHARMPDKRRPILLHEGVRVEFPPATCSVKAPRRKGRR